MTPQTPTTRHETNELREWSWLMDNAGEGTAFVTDDPHNSQRPIVGGLSKSIARAIVDDHNAALRHAHQQGREAERASIRVWLTESHGGLRAYLEHSLDTFADATASEPGERP